MTRDDVKAIAFSCLVVAAFIGIGLTLGEQGRRDSEWQEAGHRLDRHEVPGGWIYRYDSFLVFVPAPK